MNRTGLTCLPDNCLVKLKSLRSFSAGDNCISQLQDGLFDGLQHLTSISLPGNRISSIGLHVFSNASDLTNLRRISLEDNLLTSLEPWPIIRGLVGSFTSKVYILLRFNLISRFTNNLNYLYRCGTKVFFEVDIRNNLITHSTDLLNGFNVTIVTAACLMNLHKAEGSKSTKFDSMIQIGHNPYTCDCADFDVIKYDTYYYRAHLFRECYCSLPLRLTNTEIPRVRLSEFECDIVVDCPASCRCVYRPHNATMHVDCTASNLSSLPVTLPTLTKSYANYKLVFDDNRLLMRLEGWKLIDNHGKVAVLDLSGSSIDEIDEDVWSNLTRIKVVSLSGNQLEVLPRSVHTSHTDNVKLLL